MTGGLLCTCIPSSSIMMDVCFRPSTMSMQYYKHMMQSYDDTYDVDTYKLPQDDEYIEKMRAILSASPILGVPREPTAISGGVYVGSTANAENIALLKSMHISHILNCAGDKMSLKYRRIRQFYTPESGVQGYEELPIQDSEFADIRSYFDRAHAFIDYARAHNGKVLIHCPGVSRSGAVAIAYLVRNGTPLLEATQVLKQRRRCALANEGFMRQLVQYARARGMVEGNPRRYSAPRYYRPLNGHRIKTAHLPLFL